MQAGLQEAGTEVGRALMVLGGAALAGLAVATAVDMVVRGLGRLPRTGLLPGRLSRSCRRPLLATLVALAPLLALPAAGLSREVADVVGHALELLLIAGACWLVAKGAFVVEDLVLARVRVDVRDNRRARHVRTQVTLLRRLTAAVAVFVGIGLSLLTFDALRTVGASLLASAGLVGVIAGLAAQTTLSNVFAGIQLAVTDALRLDDAVVVQNEWGWVEEITLTYVVLHLWDERRLVLPTSWFTTNAFQNWTRNQSRVLGEVVLHVDYGVSVEELRQEAHRIVEASPLWDREAWVLQVVDTTPSTMVVRVLASAADAPTAFDLRCELREKLISWLQAEHPEGLPRLRTERVDASRTAGEDTAARHDVTAPGQGRSQFSAA